MIQKNIVMIGKKVQGIYVIVYQLETSFPPCKLEGILPPSPSSSPVKVLLNIHFYEGGSGRNCNNKIDVEIFFCYRLQIKNGFVKKIDCLNF